MGLAARYGLIDVVTKGGGSIAGVVGGLKIGLLTGSPVGVLVGSVAGAFAGSLTGTEIGRRWKERPLIEAEQALDGALSRYLEGCSDAERLTDLIEDELKSRREARDRWRDAEQRMRPELDASLVTTVHSTVKLAEEALTVAETDSAALLPVVRSALAGSAPQVAALGAMLANCPELADWVRADSSYLESVREARLRCLKEREKLSPGSTPLATADAVIGRARFGVPVVHLSLDGYFHGRTALIGPDFHSPCAELERELEEPRRRYDKARNSSSRLVRAGAEKAIKGFNTADLGRVTHNRVPAARPCPYCGQDVIEEHRERVRRAGMRIGWYVDPDRREWMCDRHQMSGCAVCPPGL